MPFELDARLTQGGYETARGPLSHIILKDESRFPWFVLVPRVENVTEIDELSTSLQQTLMMEVTIVSKWIKKYFAPDKVNVANLGNMVSQLHIHIVGRFKTDPFWPHAIWQPSYVPSLYEPNPLSALISATQSHFQSLSQGFSTELRA